ncbi:DUF1851 domain-containing protein [Piscinibacter terrae]|uniref:DUF1851 domain-containing protein n=1 Tax=Piscinibacter terrae TaxID=2496871 RepID=A0A3N7HJL6_9BURK|nr:DUF1851 domain-containing protein [Albitalea terrae]RQP21146.1 DUF1851 domain-containing protein [Albitalea terrae]
MNLSDYLLAQDGHDWPSLLSDWAEVLPGDFIVWIVNRLGDLVVVLPDGSVHWLDVGNGSLKRVADNREHFVSAIDEGDNANEWLAIPLVDACVASGMALGAGQCYGFKVPPMLGGAYEVSNLEPTSLAVHYGLLGQIHRQTKDLPDGTQIKFVLSP